MKTLSNAALLLTLTLISRSAAAQINAGTMKDDPNVPFTMTKVAEFRAPWRIAFLPDGRMLVTDKVGPLWLVTQTGLKTAVDNVPAVLFPTDSQAQGGMLGVFLSPHYATDQSIYLTYSEPGDDAGTSGLALARARLKLPTDNTSPATLEGLQVVWRDMPKGHGGQFGAQLAFSPDGRYLFLAVGDRQRMTPAQDPNTGIGKILRLTLDGKPAPGNPMAGKTGTLRRSLIDPPHDTEAAKTAPVIRTYRVEGPNLAPAETWSSGHRNPLGLAFAPDGRLWEVEHGPRGGDELNLIEPGNNYGWPLVSYAVNYDGVPIPSPDTRPDLAKPVIYWTPVIAPGNLIFYNGDMFSQWKGSALISGLSTMSLSRITFDEKGRATPAERWRVEFRVRDVEVGPDGALWMLEDGSRTIPGALFRLTPKHGS
jgi:glucose/arabinose dehydrogenase